MSEECEFGELKDSLIRDLIICGVNDSRLRERMLREPELDLQRAIKLGQAAEETKQHVKELSEGIESPSSVHYVKKNTKTFKPQASIKSQPGSNKSTIINSCKFCGRSHKRGECPAYGRKCHKCKKQNHFAKFCQNKYVHHVTHDYSSSSEDENSEFFIGTINASGIAKPVICDKSRKREVLSVQQDVNSSDWSVDLCINKCSIQFKIDTGAQCNILPESIFLHLRPRPKIHSSTAKLTAYNGSDIPVKGTFVANVEYKNNLSVPVMFVIADTIFTPILGLPTSEKLNLIKRVMVVDNVQNCYQDLLAKFSNCFGELGMLPREYHIMLKDDVKPVDMPPRKIPIALKDQLKDELDIMVKNGVIIPIQEPTDWVNSLVIVEKPNGKLRICLDPRPLNRAIKREHFQLPTTENILSQMSGARYFSKLDASQGYWHIKVDEESSKLLTFATPFGRYHFKRLPFGIHSASEIFQIEIANIIAGIEGTANSQDDIIVWGNSRFEHDNRLQQVLKSVSKAGLKLNKEKCIFGESQVKFLGHIVSRNGIKADPAKLSAVRDMPIPENKKSLQSFLGMVNYLGKFINNLSELTAPLRTLLIKDSVWSLDEPQIAAINRLKEVLTTAPVLNLYNPSLPTRVSVDASSHGLGAILEQQDTDAIWKPIGFASRSLTSAERNYAQIENETLAIVFACEKFHDYLYGRSFVVFSDHRPLKSIFSKSLTQCPPRIQRFILHLQKYRFDLDFVPGKDMNVSDALSRAHLKDVTSEIPKSEMELYIHSIVSNLPISEQRWKQLQFETAEDSTLQLLKNYTLHGWPSAFDQSVKPFFSIREEISYHDGVLLKGQRVIVPLKLRAEIKSILHQGHIGISRTQANARNSVFGQILLPKSLT